MEELGTFISLFRRFKDWEWYKDVPVKTVFIHCLIRANFKPQKYKGKIIERGSFVTSRKNLSSEVGLSEQQVRSALKKLKSTSEITCTSTNHETIITVVNYNKYQLNGFKNNQQDNQLSNQQITNEQPTNNQRITTINKDNTLNKENNHLLIDKIYVENPVEILENEMLENDLSYSLENCNPIDYFETEFGRPISQVEVMRIGQMISENGQLLVMYALREALTYEKKNIDYIDRILYNWREQGFTTNDYEEGKR